MPPPGWLVQAVNPMSRDVTAATPSAERATFLDDFSDPALARYYEVTPGIGNVVRRTDGLHYDIVRATDPPDEWSEILIGESSFACGNMADAEAANRRAANIATSPKPLRSAADQLDIFASVSFQPTQAAALSDQLRTMASAVEAGIPLPTDQPASQNIAENAPPMLVHVSDIHFGSKQETPNGSPRQRL